jgi:hypothetical protein
MRKTSVHILCLVALFLGVNLKVQAQTWSFTGNMNVARTGHTATLLNNGEVLVAGGYRGGGVYSSAELYNPSAGTFSYTGSMNTGRISHAAVLLPSGEVLIVGGETLFPTNCLSSAELFNPSTGTFSYTGSLTTAMCYPTATTLKDGKVLVAYGATAELYDPSAGAFSVTGSLQVSRAGATTTLLGNGKVLFAGGNDASNNTLESAELYDPSSGTFSLTGSMEAQRFGHSATALSNGEVLIAGGAYYYSVPNPPGPPQIWTGFLNEAELYNPASGTFTVTGSMAQARAYHVAALLPSGKVMVGTGAGNNSAELYDPSSASFSLSAYPNDERDGGAQAVVLDSGLPLVMGGYRNYHVYRPIYWNTAEIFNATTPNFTLSASPASQTVAQGSATTYTLTVTPSNGFAGNVTLSLEPLPTGVTATFNKNPIPNGSGTSTLTVTPTSSTTPGQYQLTIIGTSGSLSQGAFVTMNVTARHGR